MRLSILVEVEWGFEEGSVDWNWCVENATFVHREACEFILHVGPTGDDAGDSPYWQYYVGTMRVAGCTDAFIDAYIAAKDLGAERVLFHV